MNVIVQKLDGEQLELSDAKDDCMFVGEKSVSDSPFLQVQVKQIRGGERHWASVYLDHEDAAELVAFITRKLAACVPVSAAVDA